MKTATAPLLDAPAAPIVESSTAIQVVPSEGVSMFERLACDPNVPVEKLERLIAMQERIVAHNAKAEFDAAYAQMQGEIPIITERGEILVNGQLRSKYAKLEDIIRIVRPIMQLHGFAVRHSHEFLDGKIKIVGILSHRSGHSERDEFITDSDTGAGRTAIQALGSARSYGQRYTLMSLLGIATSGVDDDGVKAGQTGKKEIVEPNGFEDWWIDMGSVASEGIGKLSAAWNNSKGEFRAHLKATNNQGWETLKAKAQKAGA